MHIQSSHKNTPYMHSHYSTEGSAFMLSSAAWLFNIILQAVHSFSFPDSPFSLQEEISAFTSVSRSVWPTARLSVTMCMSASGEYLLCECRMNGVTALFSVPVLHASLICFVKPWRIQKDSDGTLQIQIVLLCLGTALGTPPLTSTSHFGWKDEFLTYSFICVLSLLSFLSMHNVNTQIVDTRLSFDC